MTGVSLGALNAYILAAHQPNEKDKAIERLRKFWIEFSQREPYKEWAGGFVYGFFFEKGIYDIAPTANFIREQFADLTEVYCHLNIAVTNILNGQFSIFDESTPFQDLMNILVASVSFSGISPAQEHGESIYISGNAVYENDVLSVINHCESLGYAEQDIVIDTILSGKRSISDYDGSGANAFSVLKRSSVVFKYYQHMHGIMRAKDGHRNVNFRYVVGPEFDLPSKVIPLNYSERETEMLMELGERDAKGTIYKLLYKTDEEISERINSSMEIRFYNKERQRRHEEKMRSVFNAFISREIQKVTEAAQRAHGWKTHPVVPDDGVDNFDM